jgi:hypothetical protein
MKQFAMESRQTSRNSKAFLAILFVLVAGSLLSAQLSPPHGAKFEVLSVRVLGDKEASERSPDFIGPNIAVRLRLSSTEHGLEFYGWKNSTIPAGYKVQELDQSIFWLYGKAGTEKKMSSPGLKTALFGSTGDWITLPAHSAVEWEELDSTSFAGEKHAFTAFLKQKNKDEALEVISDAFVVPANVNK